MDRELWFDHHAFYADFEVYAKRRGFTAYSEQDNIPGRRNNLIALCREVGVDRTTMRNLARGVPVSLDTVCRLAWWADMSLDRYVIPGGRIVARQR